MTQTNGGLIAAGIGAVLATLTAHFLNRHHRQPHSRRERKIVITLSGLSVLVCLVALLSHTLTVSIVALIVAAILSSTLLFKFDGPGK